MKCQYIAAPSVALLVVAMLFQVSLFVVVSSSGSCHFTHNIRGEALSSNVQYSSFANAKDITVRIYSLVTNKLLNYAKSSFMDSGCHM